MQNKLNFKVDQIIYPSEKERTNKETIWEHYFARKTAFLIAPIFIGLGISANQISFFSIAAGIIGSILIAVGNFWLILIGGILMQFWLIFDKTDGLVARFKNTTSKFGEFFEELNGSLIAVLFFLSIGFASSKFPGFLPFSLYFPPKIFIILGLATSLFIIFRHLISRHFEAVFQNNQVNGNISDGGLFANLYKIVIRFSGVYSLAQPIFLIAAIFNFLGLYILVYFIIQGVLMLANVFYLINKAAK